MSHDTSSSHAQHHTTTTHHRSYSQKAEERERYWRAKLDEVQLRAEEQAAAAEQRWAAGAAEAQARWRGKVDELRHAWGAEQAALEAEWSEKMEQSHTRWLRVGGGPRGVVWRYHCCCGWLCCELHSCAWGAPGDAIMGCTR
jgi:hypothetical protein